MHACAHSFWPNHFSISYLIHNNLKYLNLNLLETKTFLSNHNTLIPCGRFHFIILLSNIQSILIFTSCLYLPIDFSSWHPCFFRIQPRSHITFISRYCHRAFLFCFVFLVTYVFKEFRPTILQYCVILKLYLVHI